MRYTRSQLRAEANSRAGCKALRICRSTGTLVGLYEAEPANLDTDDGAWATVCETHGSIVMHRTRTTAESHLSHPEEWCDECREPGEEENYENVRAL